MDEAIRLKINMRKKKNANDYAYGKLFWKYFLDFLAYNSFHTIFFTEDLFILCELLFRIEIKQSRWIERERFLKIRMNFKINIWEKMDHCLCDFVYMELTFIHEDAAY